MSEHKRRIFWISTAISLAVVAFFMANVPLTPQMAVVSCLAVIGLAVPSYMAVVKFHGWQRGVGILLALGVYGLVIESLAIATGYPYGDFVYTGLLAGKVFGLTPWTVAFAYPPIILLAYTLARRIAVDGRWWKIIGLTSLLATAVDVVLDPAAVRLRFWYWEEPGMFHGVPLVNFIGWLLTAAIAGSIVHVLWGGRQVPAAAAYSGLAILWLWTAASAWFGHLVPCAVGIVLLYASWRVLFRQRVQ